jgi:hypothetical protein
MERHCSDIGSCGWQLGVCGGKSVTSSVCESRVVNDGGRHRPLELLGWMTLGWLRYPLLVCEYDIGCGTDAESFQGC